MNHPSDDKPPVLEYCTNREDRGLLLLTLSVAALGWAFLTLRLTNEIAKQPQAVARNSFRLRTQVVLLSCAAIRLAWALHRKERGRGWLFYFVLLLLAAPLWIFSELMSD